MNTETTVNNEALGWIFYDATCSLCACSAARANGLLERRGFRLIPLQTPGTAKRLGVTTDALLARMHLLMADGRRFAGADAFVEIARHVRWTRPFVAATQLPAVLPLLRRCYDWIAAKRYCFGGSCRIPAVSISVLFLPLAWDRLKRAFCRKPARQKNPARPQPDRKIRRKTKRVFFEMP